MQWFESCHRAAYAAEGVSVWTVARLPSVSVYGHHPRGVLPDKKLFQCVTCHHQWPGATSRKRSRDLPNAHRDGREGNWA